MSYDFMMFEPRRPILSMSDIEPQNLSLQNGVTVKAELTELYPALEWEDKG